MYCGSPVTVNVLLAICMQFQAILKQIMMDNCVKCGYFLTVPAHFSIKGYEF